MGIGDDWERQNIWPNYRLLLPFYLIHLCFAEFCHTLPLFCCHLLTPGLLLWHTTAAWLELLWHCPFAFSWNLFTFVPGLVHDHHEQQTSAKHQVPLYHRCGILYNFFFLQDMQKMKIVNIVRSTDLDWGKADIWRRQLKGRGEGACMTGAELDAAKLLQSDNLSPLHLLFYALFCIPRALPRCQVLPSLLIRKQFIHWRRVQIGIFISDQFLFWGWHLFDALLTGKIRRQVKIITITKDWPGWFELLHELTDQTYFFLIKQICVLILSSKSFMKCIYVFTVLSI